MARPTRPTLRCLLEDLELPIPPINQPLDEIRHPVLTKAVAQFTDDDNRHDRILAIDDEVFFKVKAQRWRGAVWLEPDQPWVVAAGWRESESTDDFYAALTSTARKARARYNTENRPALNSDTHTAYLLPTADDRLRYQLEAGIRFVRQLEALVSDLLRRSLHDGHEHAADLATFTLGIQVRADHGHETYVAVRITGSTPADLTQVILDIVPGCDQGGWFPEFVLPDRHLNPNEQAWSNIMDASAAAKLLDADEI